MDSYQKIIDELTKEKLKEIIDNGEDPNQINFYEKIDKIYSESLENATDGVFKTLLIDSARMYEEEKLLAEDYNKRLEEQWYEALLHLQCIIKISEESSIQLLEALDKGIEDDKKKKILSVLFKIHSKSIQISKEIFTLIKSGFPDGALARWRSLHESNVIFSLLTKKYNEDIDFTFILIERYLDFISIERAKELRIYKISTPKLGLKAIDRNTEREILEKRREIIKKYGKEFAYPNMWAKPLFPKNIEKIEFYQLEKIAELDRLNAYYNQANLQVHTSPKGMYQSLSFMPDFNQEDFYLYGGTNYGLSTPIQLTSISCMQITTKLMLIESNFDKQMVAKVLMKFVDECNDRSHKIQKNLEEISKQ